MGRITPYGIEPDAETITPYGKGVSAPRQQVHIPMQPKKKKWWELALEAAANTAKGAGKATKDYVDQDKKGIGVGDVLTAPSRAGYDLLIKPTAELAKDQIMSTGKLMAGTVLNDKKLIDEAKRQNFIARSGQALTEAMRGKEIGKNIGKAGGEFVTSAIDAAPLAGLKKLAVKQGDSVGKALLKGGAEASAIVGTYSGAQALEEGKPEEALRRAAEGALIGGPLGVGAAGAGKVIGKQLEKGSARRQNMLTTARLNEMNKTIDANSLPAGEEVLGLPAGATKTPEIGAGKGYSTPGKIVVGPDGKEVKSAQEVVNTLVKDRAEMLRSVHKETGGVHLLKNEEGEVTGRASSNDQFYRAFYKENKRPPRKDEWEAEAHRQLNSGSDNESIMYKDALSAVHEPPQRAMTTGGTTNPLPVVNNGPEAKPLTKAEKRVIKIDELLTPYKAGGETNLTPAQAAKLQKERNTIVEVANNPNKVRELEAEVARLDDVGMHEAHPTRVEAEDNLAQARIIGQDLVAEPTPKLTPEELTAQRKADVPDATIAAKEAGVQEKVFGTTIDDIGSKKGRANTGIARKAESVGTLGGLGGKAEAKGSQIVDNLISSKHVVARTVGKTLQAWARDAGKSSKYIKERRTFLGGKSYGKEVAGGVQEHFYKLIDNNLASRERVFAVLDPELAKNKVDEASLTPKEKEAANFIRQISDFINDLNYNEGNLSREKWESNRGGKYITRAYKDIDFEPEEMSAFMKDAGLKVDDRLYKKRSEVTDHKIEQAITDPGYLIAKAMERTIFNREVKRMGNWLADSKYTKDLGDAPAGTVKQNHIKLSDSPMYGKMANQWVRKDIFEDMTGFFFVNKQVQKIYEALKVYEALPPRQARKKLLTVYSVATNAVNFNSGYVFGHMAGINPAAMATNQPWALKQLRNNGKEYLWLKKNGYLHTDILGKELANKSQQITSKDLTAGKMKKGWKKLQKVDEKAVEFYSHTDDLNKLAAIKTHMNRGDTLEEAAEKMAQGFQDYSTVGIFFDISAKVPVFGNAFARFAGDFTRITKNAGKNHPIRMATSIMALGALADFASRVNGENEQDRQTRESRLGAPRIPGTNISLEFQTPYGAVDVSKMFGTVAVNSNDANPFSDADRILPLNDNVNSDPLIGPLVSIAQDKDFKGDSIKDPSQKPGAVSTLTKEEQSKKQRDYLGRNLLSNPTINDTADTIDAARGKENFYGQKKSVAQELVGFAGLKLNPYGSDRAQKARDGAAYGKMKELQPVDAGIRELSNQKFQNKITEEEYSKRLDNLKNEKRRVLDGIKKEGLGEDVALRLEQAFSDIEKKPVSVFEAADKFKASTGNKLAFMQMRRAAGDDEYNKFFSQNKSLDPLSDEFNGFNTTNYKQLSAGMEKARAAGAVLPYMQAHRLANPDAYQKFFADKGNIDPRSEDFEGLRFGRDYNYRKSQQRYARMKARNAVRSAGKKVRLKTRKSKKIRTTGLTVRKPKKYVPIKLKMK